ncbi:MAG: hypothetical protein JSU00_27350 [Acidobacteria bacterium]|nr:hypothetical protein [Acidobacteriota bacterium]
MLCRPTRLLLLAAATALVSPAQTTRQSLPAILGFENNSAPGVVPAGWSIAAGFVVDDHIVHGGRFSARVERTATSSGSFTTLLQSIPIDFAGRSIMWRGYIRTENVSDVVALWIREDNGAAPVDFSTTQNLQIKGTSGWTQYATTIPWNGAARTLVFGFFLQGSGKAWVDDLELLVDGVPIDQAPSRPIGVFDTDHDFDNGSTISRTSLSTVQIDNLAKLAKVWGFLKYHHPAVTSGTHHWDYELFRATPYVLLAEDSAAANAAILKWIGNQGAVAACAPCATLAPENLQLAPDIGWISDTAALGPDLSGKLQEIYRNRRPAPAQFYVSLQPNTANPSFDNEQSYPSVNLPDTGYQLLGLFRLWNIVRYFSPNREIMADNPAGAGAYWDQVLLDAIPPIALARTGADYQRELLRVIAKINDTHANLWSSLAVRPPEGDCYLPVDIRFAEGSPIVIRHTSPTLGPASGLLPGDVIQTLNGASISSLIAQWTPLYADSNQAARLRDIGASLTRGACAPVDLTVRRNHSTLTLRPTRSPSSLLDFSRTNQHDRPGPAFQMLSKDIAYLKLSSVKVADSPSYVNAASSAKGLIIDIRNYPSEFVVFSLGSLLVSQPTPFVRFTQADPANPGAFYWTEPLALPPGIPHYEGKIVILVDEVTQSQAEYTAMAFRTAPGAVVMGGATAGADGDVSSIALPGGFNTMISGIGVYYPDYRPTQRIGIIPDIVVTPTLEGLAAGRDELLERAMRYIDPKVEPNRR